MGSIHKGTVYLIGAGPGDPGLLTLRGQEILSRADVVVYDYLASPALLAHARPDAEICYVGKKGGEHTLPQHRINDLLVQKARAGLSVARLKGGDPYMFGRGAEEAEELLAASVPFEVVPGVSSALAATAYAGIPLTHRAYASSVCFATGHEDPAKTQESHNWAALAQGASTLVFFMGMKNLPDIVRKLIDNGMSPETPAALIRWGTTPQHRSVTATLASLEETAKAHGFSAPSLIVVGEVVRLHDSLNFFEKRPLLGRRVVVTRSREQASNLAGLLADQGAEVVEFPAIRIEPIQDPSPAQAAISHLSDYDWLVFTSANAVHFFRQHLEALGLDARALAGVKVEAIGPATAEAVAAMGIRPDLVPPRYVAEAALAALRETGVTGKRFLIPRALEARDILPNGLREAGAMVDVVPLYRTVPENAAASELSAMLERGDIDAVTFASSSTVTNFLDAVPAESLRGKTTLACIGPVTAETLRSHGLACDIMPIDHSIPALVDALARHFTPQGKEPA